MNTNTRKRYLLRMTYVNSLPLGKIHNEVIDFLDTFPHNTMTIPKEKASKLAYKASEVVWELHPAVREALNDISNTLYLALNDQFVLTLPKEVAKLQRAVERLLEAYSSIKSNPHMNAYFKDIPLALKKPKEYSVAMVESILIIGEDRGIIFDKEALFQVYKNKYQEVLAEEKN